MQHEAHTSSVTSCATHVRAGVCGRVSSCVLPVCVYVHPVTHLAPVFCQWNSKAGRVLFLAKINVIGSLVFRMESPAWALPAALFAPLNLKRSYPTAPLPPPPTTTTIPCLPVFRFVFVPSPSRVTRLGFLSTLCSSISAITARKYRERLCILLRGGGHVWNVSREKLERTSGNKFTPIDCRVCMYIFSRGFGKLSRVSLFFASAHNCTARDSLFVLFFKCCKNIFLPRALPRFRLYGHCQNIYKRLLSRARSVTSVVGGANA